MFLQIFGLGNAEVWLCLLYLSYILFLLFFSPISLAFFDFNMFMAQGLCTCCSLQWVLSLLYPVTWSFPDCLSKIVTVHSWRKPSPETKIFFVVFINLYPLCVCLFLIYIPQMACELYENSGCFVQTWLSVPDWVSLSGIFVRSQ